MAWASLRFARAIRPRIYALAYRFIIIIIIIIIIAITTMHPLLLCALLFGATLAAQTPALSAEAEAFLKQLPADLQERQATAIRQALAGHPTALHAERAARLRAARPTPSDATLTVRDERLAGGLRLRFYEPTGSAPSATVLYLHGGGWVLGSVDSCDAFCAALARQTRVRVVSVDYRLAPERPFPAAREDALAAVAHLRARPTGALVLAGDSAGGNLALSIADACRPDGLLLFYPVVDATADNRPSWQRYAKGYGLDADLMVAFNEAYAPEALRRTSPLLSPLRALDALPRLPPSLIQTIAARNPHNESPVERPSCRSTGLFAYALRFESW